MARPLNSRYWLQMWKGVKEEDYVNRFFVAVTATNSLLADQERQIVTDWTNLVFKKPDCAKYACLALENYLVSGVFIDVSNFLNGLPGAPAQNDVYSRGLLECVSYNANEISRLLGVLAGVHVTKSRGLVAYLMLNNNKDITLMTEAEVRDYTRRMRTCAEDLVSCMIDAEIPLLRKLCRFIGSVFPEWQSIGDQLLRSQTSGLRNTGDVRALLGVAIEVERKLDGVLQAFDDCFTDLPKAKLPITYDTNSVSLIDCLPIWFERLKTNTSFVGQFKDFIRDRYEELECQRLVTEIQFSGGQARAGLVSTLKGILKIRCVDGDYNDAYKCIPDWLREELRQSTTVNLPQGRHYEEVERVVAMLEYITAQPTVRQDSFNTYLSRRVIPQYDSLRPLQVTHPTPQYLGVIPNNGYMMQGRLERPVERFNTRILEKTITDDPVVQAENKRLTDKSKQDDLTLQQQSVEITNLQNDQRILRDRIKTLTQDQTQLNALNSVLRNTSTVDPNEMALAIQSQYQTNDVIELVNKLSTSWMTPFFVPDHMKRNVRWIVDQIRKVCAKAEELQIAAELNGVQTNNVADIVTFHNTTYAPDFNKKLIKEFIDNSNEQFHSKFTSTDEAGKHIIGEYPSPDDYTNVIKSILIAGQNTDHDKLAVALKDALANHIPSLINKLADQDVASTIARMETEIDEHKETVEAHVSDLVTERAEIKKLKEEIISLKLDLEKERQNGTELDNSLRAERLSNVTAQVEIQKITGKFQETERTLNEHITGINVVENYTAALIGLVDEEADAISQMSSALSISLTDNLFKLRKCIANLHDKYAKAEEHKIKKALQDNGQSLPVNSQVELLKKWLEAAKNLNNDSESLKTSQRVLAGTMKTLEEDLTKDADMNVVVGTIKTTLANYGARTATEKINEEFTAFLQYIKNVQKYKQSATRKVRTEIEDYGNALVSKPSVIGSCVKEIDEIIETQPRVELSVGTITQFIEEYTASLLDEDDVGKTVAKTKTESVLKESVEGIKFISAINQLENARATEVSTLTNKMITLREKFSNLMSRDIIDELISYARSLTELKMATIEGKPIEDLDTKLNTASKALSVKLGAQNELLEVMSGMLVALANPTVHLNLASDLVRARIRKLDLNISSDDQEEIHSYEQELRGLAPNTTLFTQLDEVFKLITDKTDEVTKIQDRLTETINKTDHTLKGLKTKMENENRNAHQRRADLEITHSQEINQLKAQYLAIIDELNGKIALQNQQEGISSAQAKVVELLNIYKATECAEWDNIRNDTLKNLKVDIGEAYVDELLKIINEIAECNIRDVSVTKIECVDYLRAYLDHLKDPLDEEKNKGFETARLPFQDVNGKRFENSVDALTMYFRKEPQTIDLISNLTSYCTAYVNLIQSRSHETEKILSHEENKLKTLKDGKIITEMITKLAQAIKRHTPASERSMSPSNIFPPSNGEPRVNEQTDLCVRYVDDLIAYIQNLDTDRFVETGQTMSSVRGLLTQSEWGVSYYNKITELKIVIETTQTRLLEEYLNSMHDLLMNRGLASKHTEICDKLQLSLSGERLISLANSIHEIASNRASEPIIANLIKYMQLIIAAKTDAIASADFEYIKNSIEQTKKGKTLTQMISRLLVVGGFQSTTPELIQPLPAMQQLEDRWQQLLKPNFEEIYNMKPRKGSSIDQNNDLLADYIAVRDGYTETVHEEARKKLCLALSDIGMLEDTHTDQSLLGLADSIVTIFKNFKSILEQLVKNEIREDGTQKITITYLTDMWFSNARNVFQLALKSYKETQDAKTEVALLQCVLHKHMITSETLPNPTQPRLRDTELCNYNALLQDRIVVLQKAFKDMISLNTKMWELKPNEANVTTMYNLERENIVLRDRIHSLVNQMDKNNLALEPGDLVERLCSALRFYQELSEKSPQMISDSNDIFDECSGSIAAFRDASLMYQTQKTVLATLMNGFTNDPSTASTVASLRREIGNVQQFYKACFSLYPDVAKQCSYLKELHQQQITLDDESFFATQAKILTDTTESFTYNLNEIKTVMDEYKSKMTDPADTQAFIALQGHCDTLFNDYSNIKQFLKSALMSTNHLTILLHDIRAEMTNFNLADENFTEYAKILLMQDGTPSKNYGYETLFTDMDFDKFNTVQDSNKVRLQTLNDFLEQEGGSENEKAALNELQRSMSGTAGRFQRQYKSIIGKTIECQRHGMRSRLYSVGYEMLRMALEKSKHEQTCLKDTILILRHRLANVEQYNRSSLEEIYQLKKRLITADPQFSCPEHVYKYVKVNVDDLIEKVKANDAEGIANVHSLLKTFDLSLSDSDDIAQERLNLLEEKLSLTSKVHTLNQNVSDLNEKLSLEESRNRNEIKAFKEDLTSLLAITKTCMFVISGFVPQITALKHELEATNDSRFESYFNNLANFNFSDALIYDHIIADINVPVFTNTDYVTLCSSVGPLIASLSETILLTNGGHTEIVVRQSPIVNTDYYKVLTSRLSTENNLLRSLLFGLHSYVDNIFNDYKEALERLALTEALDVNYQRLLSKALSIVQAFGKTGDRSLGELNVVPETVIENIVASAHVCIKPPLCWPSIDRINEIRNKIANALRSDVPSNLKFKLMKSLQDSWMPPIPALLTPSQPQSEPSSPNIDFRTNEFFYDREFNQPDLYTKTPLYNRTTQGLAFETPLYANLSNNLAWNVSGIDNDVEQYDRQIDDAGLEFSDFNLNKNSLSYQKPTYGTQEKIRETLSSFFNPRENENVDQETIMRLPVEEVLNQAEIVIGKYQNSKDGILGKLTEGKQRSGDTVVRKPRGSSLDSSLQNTNFESDVFSKRSQTSFARDDVWLNSYGKASNFKPSSPRSTPHPLSVLKNLKTTEDLKTKTKHTTRTNKRKARKMKAQLIENIDRISDYAVKLKTPEKPNYATAFTKTSSAVRPLVSAKGFKSTSITSVDNGKTSEDKVADYSLDTELLVAEEEQTESDVPAVEEASESEENAVEVQQTESEENAVEEESESQAIVSSDEDTETDESSSDEESDANDDNDSDGDDDDDQDNKPSGQDSLEPSQPDSPSDPPRPLTGDGHTPHTQSPQNDAAEPPTDQPAQDALALSPSNVQNNEEYISPTHSIEKELPATIIDCTLETKDQNVSTIRSTKKSKHNRKKGNRTRSVENTFSLPGDGVELQTESDTSNDVKSLGFKQQVTLETETYNTTIAGNVASETVITMMNDKQTINVKTVVLADAVKDSSLEDLLQDCSLNEVLEDNEIEPEAFGDTKSILDVTTDIVRNASKDSVEGLTRLETSPALDLCALIQTGTTNAFFNTPPMSPPSVRITRDEEHNTKYVKLISTASGSHTEPYENELSESFSNANVSQDDIFADLLNKYQVEIDSPLDVRRIGNAVHALATIVRDGQAAYNGLDQKTDKTFYRAIELICADISYYAAVMYKMYVYLNKIIKERTTQKAVAEHTPKIVFAIIYLDMGLSPHWDAFYTFIQYVHSELCQNKTDHPDHLRKEAVVAKDETKLLMGDLKEKASTFYKKLKRISDLIGIDRDFCQVYRAQSGLAYKPSYFESLYFKETDRPLIPQSVPMKTIEKDEEVVVVRRKVRDIQQMPSDQYEDTTLKTYGRTLLNGLLRLQKLRMLGNPVLKKTMEETSSLIHEPGDEHHMQLYDSESSGENTVVTMDRLNRSIQSIGVTLLTVSELSNKQVQVANLVKHVGLLHVLVNLILSNDYDSDLRLKEKLDDLFADLEEWNDTYDGVINEYFECMGDSLHNPPDVSVYYLTACYVQQVTVLHKAIRRYTAAMILFNGKVQKPQKIRYFPFMGKAFDQLFVYMSTWNPTTVTQKSGQINLMQQNADDEADVFIMNGKETFIRIEAPSGKSEKIYCHTKPDEALKSKSSLMTLCQELNTLACNFMNIYESVRAMEAAACVLLKKMIRAKDDEVLLNNTHVEILKLLYVFENLQPRTRSYFTFALKFENVSTQIEKVIKKQKIQFESDDEEDSDEEDDYEPVDQQFFNPILLGVQTTKFKAACAVANAANSGRLHLIMSYLFKNLPHNMKSQLTVVGAATEGLQNAKHDKRLLKVLSDGITHSYTQPASPLNSTDAINKQKWARLRNNASAYARMKGIRCTSGMSADDTPYNSSKVRCLCESKRTFYAKLNIFNSAEKMIMLPCTVEIMSFLYTMVESILGFRGRNYFTDKKIKKKLAFFNDFMVPLNADQMESYNPTIFFYACEAPSQSASETRRDKISNEKKLAKHLDRRRMYAGRIIELEISKKGITSPETIHYDVDGIVRIACNEDAVSQEKALLYGVILMHINKDWLPYFLFRDNNGVAEAIFNDSWFSTPETAPAGEEASKLVEEVVLKNAIYGPDYINHPEIANTLYLYKNKANMYYRRNQLANFKDLLKALSSDDKQFGKIMNRQTKYSMLTNYHTPPSETQSNAESVCVELAQSQLSDLSNPDLTISYSDNKDLLSDDDREGNKHNSEDEEESKLTQLNSFAKERFKPNKTLISKAIPTEMLKLKKPKDKTTKRPLTLESTQSRKKPRKSQPKIKFLYGFDENTNGEEESTQTSSVDLERINTENVAIASTDEREAFMLLDAFKTHSTMQNKDYQETDEIEVTKTPSLEVYDPQYKEIDEDDVENISEFDFIRKTQ
ncbi:putative glycoprotein [Ranid herpesvirus 3]|uniref:Putative glycoprotein n=1 Tax=Ranid herpesvirus 3 TaxID=1987509 RepID=A0A1X9T5B9_9VIRU|nr:putative glycoprotein [Ranid herpesvirus 3]ARR28902.1 putative glycoprotein [Ranid herpesvirus 3]